MANVIAPVLEETTAMILAATDFVEMDTLAAATGHAAEIVNLGLDVRSVLEVVKYRSMRGSNYSRWGLEELVLWAYQF